jgi:hypothetical protein
MRQEYQKEALILLEVNKKNKFYQHFQKIILFLNLKIFLSFFFSL